MFEHVNNSVIKQIVEQSRNLQKVKTLCSKLIEHDKLL